MLTKLNIAAVSLAFGFVVSGVGLTLTGAPGQAAQNKVAQPNNGNGQKNAQPAPKPPGMKQPAPKLFGIKLPGNNGNGKGNNEPNGNNNQNGNNEKNGNNNQNGNNEKNGNNNQNGNGNGQNGNGQKNQKGG